jgi:hypothetical protein
MPKSKASKLKAQLEAAEDAVQRKVWADKHTAIESVELLVQRWQSTQRDMTIKVPTWEQHHGLV